MPRIVAGSAGGRVLKVPPGNTRPTSDRVREALFALLEARLGGPTGWGGQAVLDLYAGSGALALEALSRGAATAVAVDSAPAAVRVIRANAAALGLGAGLRAVNARAEVLASRPAPDGAPFGLVFVDPPYDLPSASVSAVLAALARPARSAGGDPPGGPAEAGPGWLAHRAWVAVERSARSPALVWPAGWDNVGMRKYGDTTLFLARAWAGGQMDGIGHPAGRAAADGDTRRGPAQSEGGRP
ncbi:MAG: RsmD family RNA methyltransferase [Bifidobacteriaceae bacterium]|nr:RsmD family RNA methyltransferase [Bifidobacteriaceae bacterium]